MGLRIPLYIKFGVVDKPLEDYTVNVVANTKVLLLQAGTQQQQLDSYTKLASVSSRTGAQEPELSCTRAQLVAQCGTDKVKAIQASIDKRQEQAENNKQALRDKLAYGTNAAEAMAKVTAQAQEPLSKAARV
jgi:hypothetical protein